QPTAAAVTLLPRQARPDVVASHATMAVAVERSSRRTDTGPRLGIVCEIARLKERGRRVGSGSGFVVERIGRGFVHILRGETLVASTHVVVGNERVDRLRLELLQIGFT